VQVDRQMYKSTDMLKLIVAIHSVANMPNKFNIMIACSMYSMTTGSKIPENMCIAYGEPTSTPAFEKNLVPSC
jgi:hypothetical protein